MKKADVEHLTQARQLLRRACEATQQAFTLLQTMGHVGADKAQKEYRRLIMLARELE
jgi:hypothetical protein